MSKLTKAQEFLSMRYGEFLAVANIEHSSVALETWLRMSAVARGFVLTDAALAGRE